MNLNTPTAIAFGVKAAHSIYVEPHCWWRSKRISPAHIRWIWCFVPILCCKGLCMDSMYFFFLLFVRFLQRFCHNNNHFWLMPIQNSKSYCQQGSYGYKTLPNMPSFGHWKFTKINWINQKIFGCCEFPLLFTRLFALKIQNCSLHAFFCTRACVLNCLWCCENETSIKDKWYSQCVSHNNRILFKYRENNGIFGFEFSIFIHF